MSEFRGRGSRGSRGVRARGSFPRGGPRSSSRGGYSGDRDSIRGGFSRGRGDGFSRGRGGPPPRHLSRDGSPPRKVPLMSRGYDSDRGRGPPIERRIDRYDDSYDRGPTSRSRDVYSPPRETGRLIDRLTPPRSSLRERNHGLSSRGSADYPSSRGEYLSARSYSPPRESGSYRDSYGSSLREERRDSFTRPSLREYASRSALDYSGERSRDFRDSPRDYGTSRDYPPSARGDFRDRFHDRDHDDGRDVRGGDLEHSGGRDYSSSRFLSRQDVRVTSRGPPSREYGGRGGPRGGPRGGRDERGRGSRGSFLNGSRGRGGPPRGRGRSSFRGSRRSPPSSRDDPVVKRPRLDGDDSYSRR